MGEFFVILGTVISYRRNTSKSCHPCELSVNSMRLSGQHSAPALRPGRCTCVCCKEREKWEVSYENWVRSYLNGEVLLNHVRNVNFL